MSDLELSELEGEPNELSVLKNRARLMGLTFSNNIGVEALRKKIAEKMAETEESEESEKEAGEAQPNPLVDGTKPASDAPVPSRPLTKAEREAKIRADVQAENLALVRVRITCLDPKKKDLPGEIITVANEYLGTVKRYIPYGAKTNNGWHIEKCLFEYLKDREFLSITTTSRGGRELVEHQYVKEFAIEVLPPLTEAELAKLAAAEAAAGLTTHE